MGKDIGNKIKELRDNHKLSQQRFGHKIGLSGKTISAYETGKIDPPLKILEKISDEYGKNLVVPNKKYKKKINNRLNKIESALCEIKNLLNIDD